MHAVSALLRLARALRCCCCGAPALVTDERRRPYCAACAIKRYERGA